MARLPRPHVSDSLKIQVLERQLAPDIPRISTEKKAQHVQVLKTALAKRLKCDVEKLRLDHLWALTNREKLIELPDGSHVRRVVVPPGSKVLAYFPDANDPDWLGYRTHEDHDRKTRLSGDGAQLSDMAQQRKERNRERRASKKTRSRWPQGRKIRSRNSLRKRSP